MKLKKRISKICLIAVAISLTCLTFSCNSKSVEEVLVTSIEEQLQSSVCDISFESDLDFDWDTLYILDGLLYPDEVSKFIHLPYKGEVIQDGRGRLIFINGGEIVHESDDRLSRIHFTAIRDDKTNVIRISRSDMFCAETKVLNSVNHYYLRRP